MSPIDHRSLLLHVRRFLRSLRPPEAAWKGVSLGLLVVVSGLVAATFVGYVVLDFSAPKLLAYSTITAVLLAAGLGLRLAFALLVALPKTVRGTLLLVGPLCLTLLLAGLGLSRASMVFGVPSLIAGLLGGVLYPAWRQGWGRLRGWRPASVLVLAVLLAIGAVAVLFWPEELGVEEPRNAFLAELAEHPPGKALDLDLEDPSTPGPFAVEALTYGSGEDRQRPEYGAEVDVLARSVDGRFLVEGWGSSDDGDPSVAARLRTHYWGFGADALPLQGRVWMPGEAEAGPFPLVLIVHGNHPMEDFSDRGYAYLGELLASRGAIFVSVDENFLNSSLINEVNPFGDGGLDEENDARGWLLLEHVRQWADWNGDPDHRFHGLVDLEKVVLVGHSRGGEAVIAAAEMHGVERHPDDATHVHDHGFFDLRGIVAIAPVDGQYQPRGRRHVLTDTNYLVLHGSLDGDVSSFMGAGVLERARFTEAGRDRHRFASSLYLVGANHGQFNTDWGACDYGPLWCWLFDTGALMPASDQQQVARVYLSAFVDTVFGTGDYVPLLRDPRVGREAGWLPDAHAIANYADNRQVILVDYEEDLDPSTASVEGGRLEGRYLSRWRETWPELKWQDLDTHVAAVAWDDRTHDEGQVPSYGLRLAEPMAVSAGQELVFALADADEGTLPDDWEEEEGDDGEENGVDDGEGEQEGESPEESADDESELLDWTVVLVDVEGRSAKLPLSHDLPLVPRIESRARRLSLLSNTASSELVLRHYGFPIADFLEGAPDFDPSAVVEIRFDFDRSPRGAIVVDDLGFSGVESAIDG